VTFDRAWALLLVPLPLAWAAWQWRGAKRRAGLVLKALMLAAVLAALAEPRLSTWETKVAVTILADTSASVSAADLARESRLAADIEKARGRHWSRVMAFARETRAPAEIERSGGWALRHTAGEAGRSTDVETAIRDGIAAAPAGLIPRVVLMSDGRENRGSVLRAAWQARELGVPIDTYALEGRPRPGLRLQSVSVPSLVFSGERFPVDISVSSPRPVDGTVEIAAEGRALGSSQIRLEAGDNFLRLNTSIATAGAIELAGAIRAAGFGEARFAQAVTIRRPRVLVLTLDPAGTESHLRQTLEASQFEAAFTRAIPPSLADYQVVVLNNWDLEGTPPASKADIEDFVRQGGGLLVIGGERNVYVESKGVEDALDRVLPARLAPPRSPEGTCLVLIIDKSSSMEGKKMELARLAAIGVIDNLRPVDLVGVLIFDNSFQWAVPIRRAEEKQLIKRLVAGIMPDGGTQIAPALSEAYRRILPVNATFKHIVLLTDGISEEGDSISLAKEAVAQRVTISTVGLGQDVNRAYLERVANFARGKSYFLTDPSVLEQILLRDVMEHTGSTAIEKPAAPIVLKQAQILDGVGMESAPPLKGYVRFIAKATADSILAIEQKDPLLVRWQYGLGRSAVFTSDAKSRWADQWVRWPGFDRFWSNVFRDLLPHAQAGEANVHWDTANSRLVAEYRLARHVPEPPQPPDIFIFGPDGFREPVAVRKIASGVYRGEASIGSRQGLFRLRTLEESRSFPEVGFYRQEDELAEFGSDEGLLRRIAEFTGGRFQPRAVDVFDAGGRAVPSTMRLWPALLALAIALNLAELVARKWKGIAEWLALRSTRN
jgi:Ca-activated chloride channel family protein